MADDQDEASKTEEPTAKKLSDARAKGDVPKSADISQLASLSGAFGVVVIAGGWLTRDMVTQPDAVLRPRRHHGRRGRHPRHRQDRGHGHPAGGGAGDGGLGPAGRGGQRGARPASSCRPTRSSRTCRSWTSSRAWAASSVTDGFVQFAKSAVKFLVTGHHRLVRDQAGRGHDHHPGRHGRGGDHPAVHEAVHQVVLDGADLPDRHRRLRLVLAAHPLQQAHADEPAGRQGRDEAAPRATRTSRASRSSFACSARASG